MAMAIPTTKNQTVNPCKIKLMCLTLGLIIAGILDLKADSATHSHNVYVDFFGSSNIVSVNYDTRFGGSQVFGWRAGIGFSKSGFNQPDSYSFFADPRSGISMPLGVNALLGKHTSKFEIGIGITPSLASFRKSVSEHDDKGNHHTRYVGPTTWRGSCAFGIDLGYRLQRADGFMFRAGLSPCLDVSKSCIWLNILSFIPYISFGYTFR